MTALYTSYATSLALRDAGAPQENCERYWCPNDLSMQRLDPRGYDHEHCPSWRADEIIEAMGDRLSQIRRACEEWQVHFYTTTYRTSRGASLVEALAQAWIQVLKEEKR